MSAENAVAGVVLIALMAYAIFGGADFGGGVWSAFAFGKRRQEVKEAILRSMGPVWETNHVWLILVLVALWTAFPVVFAAVFENLFLPLTIALLGIVFRGAAFAFHHFGEESDVGLPATGLVFSVASIITPFAMGVAVGAVADGRIVVDGPPPGVFEAWLHPFPLLCGVIGLAMCAFLTPFYMLARPLGGVLQEFRQMALISSLLLGAVTALAIPVAALDAEDFYDRLIRPGPLALVAAAMVLGLLSLVVLWKEQHRFAAPVAAGTVVAMLAAWGAAQYPYIILPGLRIEDAAAHDAVLEAFLIVLPIGALVLVPSLIFLFSLFATTKPEDVESH